MVLAHGSLRRLPTGAAWTEVKACHRERLTDPAVWGSPGCVRLLRLDLAEDESGEGERIGAVGRVELEVIGPAIVHVD